MIDRRKKNPSELHMMNNLGLTDYMSCSVLFEPD